MPSLSNTYYVFIIRNKSVLLAGKLCLFKTGENVDSQVEYIFVDSKNYSIRTDSNQVRSDSKHFWYNHRKIVLHNKLIVTLTYERGPLECASYTYATTMLIIWYTFYFYRSFSFLVVSLVVLSNALLVSTDGELKIFGKNILP